LIYLIGGPPRCGKTTLARRLAALTHAPWVQTDYLEMAFSAYMPPDEYEPVRLDLGPDVPFERRNDLRYARYSAEEIIAYYRGLAAQAWPGLQAFIEYALFDEEDLIVEGYHIEPDFVRQILAADPTRSEQVRAAFLYRQDIEDILAAIKRGGGKNDWVLGSARTRGSSRTPTG
jgi:2-phosphoglycerate kinase